MMLLASLPLSACDAGLTRSHIYQPPRQITAVSVEGLPRGATVISVATADGLTLKAIKVDGKPDLPILLIFHGNASTAQLTGQWLSPLIDRGYGVVLAEYRGYAGNPGKPSQMGTAKDADAYYAYADALARTSGSPRPVIIVGHSLGGGVALDLGRRVRPQMLLTIGTFTDIPSLAPKLARGLISDRYDNVAAVNTVDVPYFILHGARDTVVPLAHAKALFETAEAAGKNGGAFVFLNEGHNPDAHLLVKAIDMLVARGLQEPVPDMPDTRIMRFRNMAGKKAS